MSGVLSACLDCSLQVTALICMTNSVIALLSVMGKLESESRIQGHIFRTAWFHLSKCQNQVILNMWNWIITSESKFPHHCRLSSTEFIF